MPEGTEVLLNTDKLQKFENSILEEINFKKNYKDLNLPQKITKIFSKGKKTFICLENEMTLAFSYGLTGEFVLEKDKNKSWIRNEEKYFVYDFITSKGIFYFSDMMRYGNLQYYTPEELAIGLKKLGPDILQEKISEDYLHSIYQKKKKLNICKVLVDQSLISGIGNMYKSEGLYEEKIHPLSNVGDISEDKFIKLIKTIRKIMKKSYKNKNDFETIVYDQKEDPYGNKVEKIKTPDGRFTSYVPKIQLQIKNDS